MVIDTSYLPGTIVRDTGRDWEIERHANCKLWRNSCFNTNYKIDSSCYSQSLKTFYAFLFLDCFWPIFLCFSLLFIRGILLSQGFRGVIRLYNTSRLREIPSHKQLGFASMYKLRYRTIPRCITSHYSIGYYHRLL